MQPPQDTQRLPAYDDATGPDHFGPGSSDHGRPDQAHGAPPTTRGRGGGRLGAGALTAIGAVTLVIVLLVGLVGLELGLRSSISDRLEQEVSASFGSNAEVELGPRPVVFSLVDDTLGSVHISTDGTPAEGSTGPAPVIDMTAEGVRTEGDLTYMDSLSGTVFVTDETMSTAAATETGGSESLLGGLTQVQSVVSDPASGTLRVSIGGLAEATVTPRVAAGRLQLEPEQASILGFQLPSGVLGGAVQMMDSTLADLPPGVEVTNARVVDGGMTLDISGRDVVFEQTR